MVSIFYLVAVRLNLHFRLVLFVDDGFSNEFGIFGFRGTQRSVRQGCDHDNFKDPHFGVLVVRTPRVVVVVVLDEGRGQRKLMSKA